MNIRGQVSIEFILLIIIGLIYIHTAIWPVVNDAAAAAEDVKAVSDTKIAAQKLANAMNEAAASNGESRKTIQLFLPAGAAMACDPGNNEIKYGLQITGLYKRVPVGCVTPTDCTGSVKLLAGANPDCTAITQAGKIEGPLFKEVVVEKIGGSISVKWAG